jgi:hypothetical protein
MKHQEDTGDGKNDEEETGDPSEAKCIREADAVTLYLGREEMEEKVVIDQQGTLQVGVRHSGSENRSPQCRI